MNNSTTLRRIAAMILRVALALSFLSAVADRFGLWGPPGTPNVAWGTFESFIEYTGLILPFLPASTISFFGWASTISEFVLAIGLLSGFYIRGFAFASGLLLLSFGLSMAFAFGLESTFTYSVWTAAASAFLLASLQPEQTIKSDNQG
ncbi:hypothetical protein L2735_17130 [Shewanella olleyana]|uniref:hypothetical protein n=1 Tax=Shewanella olleyana TaxID=135626 RepID=UPI00201044FF|nr:hypothetical protein [Shewanella olleyana]MCL1068499.1 hypothetical protein [Shewanella olleyana]